MLLRVKVNIRTRTDLFAGSIKKRTMEEQLLPDRNRSEDYAGSGPHNHKGFGVKRWLQSLLRWEISRCEILNPNTLKFGNLGGVLIMVGGVGFSGVAWTKLSRREGCKRSVSRLTEVHDRNYEQMY
jgi:hypothetical protein